MTKKKFDVVKHIKKDSRLTTRVAGKSGPHSDKRGHRQRKKTTLDYLTELEEETEGRRMDSIKVGVSDILTAFDDSSIGTRVVDPAKFNEFLLSAIESFDWASCRVTGQAYIELDSKAKDCVLGGVGKRTDNLDDYVIRFHRNRVGLYLKRGLAAEVTGVAVVVYTNYAYRNDPQVTWEEIEQMSQRNYSHVLVAVLAHSEGSSSPLTSHRFIENLAGGNNEALKWTADEIRAKAKEISNHSSTWAVVAD
jgi:hypothetical protein